MDILARQVNPQELSRMATEYYRFLGSLGKQIEESRDFIAAHPTYRVRPNIWVWDSFIAHGVKLAQAILGTKEIPAGQEKNFELTIRLFMASSRQPNKPVEWFDKNYKRLNFLHDAASKWPDKKEGESEQRFTHGPFTVHNTMGLAGADLEGIKDAITKAVMLIKGMNIPDIDKVLYGDVMIVGKLSKGTTIAWYYFNEDVVYVRPFKNAGFDELHSFIHELGHRYIHKFIDKAIWLEWRRYHDNIRYQDTPGEKVKLPEVGEPLPFDVAGFGGKRPVIQKIEGLRYYVTDTKFMNWSVIKEVLETEVKYPTPYSAKSEDEHFCEALAHRAMGKLKEPNLSAFKAVIEEGKPGWDAVKLASGIVVDGVRYVWKRAKMNHSRSNRGGGLDEFRPWALESKDGFIAQLLHTHSLPPYMEPKEPPAWKIHLRFRATTEEQNQYGAFRNMALKVRFHSPTGDEGIQEAQRKTEDAYQQLLQSRAQNKTAMAGTYVQIDRDELEAWMDTLRLHVKAYRAPNKAGIYLLPFSDTVACKLSSTIGTSDDAMGRGMASMQLSLVSRVTGQTLNKKAQGQSHFKRTTNWKKTWTEGVERMRDAYMKSAGFYDALAAIHDRDAYREDVLNAIKSAPDWQNNNILAGFYATVDKGGIMTGKQIDLMESTIDREIQRNQKPSAPATPATPAAPAQEDPLLAVLRAMYAQARRANNDWLMDFAQSVAEQIKRGRSPSPKQQEIIERNRAQFKVGMVVERYWDSLA